MHISDGILNGNVCLATTAGAAIVTAYSLRKTNQEKIPLVSVMTAALFVSSLVHFRLGPASIHLVLNGLAGIILGRSAFAAIVVSLLFQTVILNHGGITTLGANSLVMGIPALLAWSSFTYLNKLFSRPVICKWLTPFFSSLTATLVSTILLVLLLVVTGQEFYDSARILAIAYIPLSVFEGFISVCIINFIRKVSPGILDQ